MPHLYLGQPIWRTSPRPSWGMPPGMTQMLDLRPLPAQVQQGGSPQGFAFFVANERLVDETGFDYLGADLTRTLTNPQRIAWRSRLGLISTPIRSVLREVLYETLTSLADPSGDDVCPPLLPNRNGELVFGLANIRRRLRPGEVEFANIQDRLRHDYRKIREGVLAGRSLAGQHRKYLATLLRKFRLTAADSRTFIPADLPDEAPEEPATARTDDFNRADSSTLGNSSEGWSWTEVSGDLEIFSNTCANTTVTSGQALARAEDDVSTDDHFARQFVVANDSFAGVTGRFDSVAQTFYVLYVTTTPETQLWKCVAGSFTMLGSPTPSGAGSSVTLDLEVEGSSIRGRLNSVLHHNETDTAITGNLRGGIEIYGDVQRGVQVDNWSLQDIEPDPESGIVYRPCLHSRVIQIPGIRI